jgi:hypothetical protein
MAIEHQRDLALFDFGSNDPLLFKDDPFRGTMVGSAAGDWVDLPFERNRFLYTTAFAVCTGRAKWQISNYDKSIVRDLVLSTHVINPTGTNAGMLLGNAMPGGGTAIRLFDTSGSENIWTIWIKYVTI